MLFYPHGGQGLGEKGGKTPYSITRAIPVHPQQKAVRVRGENACA
jgi:hypothetical protein